MGIKKYSEQGKITQLARDYSFFHAVGHSDAIYQAKHYGIYASDMKYIRPVDNQDIQIRVVTMPDMKGDKPVVTTNITIFDKGIKAKEISSKDMSESEFNKLIYEIPKEYGIKKCSVGKNRGDGKRMGVMR